MPVLHNINQVIQNNAALQIFFNLAGGTAILIYGVEMMGEGLEKSSGRIMKKVLSVLTKNIYVAFAAGTIITMLVQSSAAISVMTVGFVNNGLLNLSQAVGIIYGTNLGTTITAQLMTLRLTFVALPIIAFGFFLMTLAQNKRLKGIGQAIMGFGFMFLGLKTLNQSIPYIRESETARQLFLQYGQNPILGVIAGLIATALVQSSTATVGLTISLFGAGLISFPAAIGITLGDNIGTCITAQVASIKTSVSARRTAWAHTLYNIIGVLIAVTILRPFASFIYWVTKELLHEPDTFLVANTHTLFNIISAALFLPLTKYYVSFLKWMIPEDK